MRPFKTGLDYFSLDTNISSDPKIIRLEAKHKLIGFAFYIKLLELIYKENGYFIELTEENVDLFSHSIRFPKKRCLELIYDCTKVGLFDANIYTMFNVLTSKRIQENYVKVCERRKALSMFRQLLLINQPRNEAAMNPQLQFTIAEFRTEANIKQDDSVLKNRNFVNETINVNNNFVNINNNSINANINQVNADICTQSKVKKIERESESKDARAQIYFFNFDEIKNWFVSQGWAQDEAVRFFAYYEKTGWLSSSGAKITNWTAAAISWCERNKNQYNKFPKPREKVNEIKLKELWDNTLLFLKNKVENDYQYFEFLFPISLKNNILTLEVSSENIIHKIENDHYEAYKNAIRSTFGKVKIEYEIKFKNG